MMSDDPQVLDGTITIGDAKADLTEQEAQRLTERIRTALDRVSTAWADLGERITEAHQRRADRALGYDSWAEYAEAELKPSEGLAADVRRQLVGLLAAEGMSTRAIAPAVGASNKTVSLDRRHVLPEVTPEPTERIDHATGEVHDTPRTNYNTGEVLAAPKVRGLDGKAYTRPEPKPSSAPPRRALTDQFFDAAYDTARRVESLHRITEDNRFTQNAEKIAQKHLSDLIHSRDLLQQVIDQLS